LALSERDKERLNLISPAANDIKLGDIIAEILEGSGEGPSTVAWADVTGKPAVIAAGADQAVARTAIGAGTSSLAIGSTASTAAAGNHAHTATQVTATAIGPGTATNVQGILGELAARIATLEAV